MEEFRDGVLTLASKSLKIMNEYFDGKRKGTDLVQEASFMVREGVKVSNRDQMNEQVKKSQIIRLMTFIPKENRADYIAMSSPEVRPFMLSRPDKV
jgi:hypothetical protein